MYHGGKYVVGKDTTYCNKPHYHIHFHSIKEISDGTLRTFRSEKFKPYNVTKSFRLYFGQDLPSADPQLWLGYALKETQVLISGLSITDDIMAHAKSQLQIKQMKAVHSEKKKVDADEKKEFKEQMYEEVYKRYMLNPHIDNYGMVTYWPRDIQPIIIDYLIEHNKVGSIKKHFYDSYYIGFMICKCNWKGKDIYEYQNR